MKLFLTFLLVGIQLAIAIQSQKPILVTYPQDTPDSILSQAKQAIIESGGHITHEFRLIKGFAAKASAAAIQSVSTLSTAYSPSIEEDQVVSIDGDLVGQGSES